jgi:peptidyl-prolyl cis-trans isomerase C
MRESMTKFASAGMAVLVLLFSAAVTMAAPVAKVNGKEITDRDVQMALSNLNEGQRATMLKDSNTRREIVNSLVDQELLVEQAGKEKLDQDQEFKDAMNAFRRNFLSSRVLQKTLGAKMSDSAAKKYYEQNKRRYSTEQVHALHILVSDEAKARELMKLAKAADADFQALAEKNSKDPSAKNNRGDLGFIARDRMVPEFTEAAFSAADGEVVGPVKTAYGYHVIKVTERKAGKPLNYEEVELRVKNDLKQELTQAYIGNLKKQAKVEITDKSLAQP